MGWKSLRGTSRQFINTETGEILSRRQYDKLTKNIKSYEEKSAENKKKDLKAALARPARGRKKAASEYESELRLKAAEEKAEQDRIKKLNQVAKRNSKKFKTKKIRPQLLVAGRKAARIPFHDYEDFQDLRKQMLAQKLPNGKRLIVAYALGIVGIDERTERELTAILITLQSPVVNITKVDFYEITDDFVTEHLYFIFSHYFLHLHFDRDYAESKLAKKNRKNLPPNLRKKRK